MSYSVAIKNLHYCFASTNSFLQYCRCRSLRLLQDAPDTLSAQPPSILLFILLISSLVLQVHFLYILFPIMSYSVSNQLIESEDFNWKCIICNILAKSPLHLEDQFIVQHGVYFDIDGTARYTWFSPYYLACTKNAPPMGE